MKKQSNFLPLIIFITAIGIAFSVNNNTHYIIYTNLKVINPMYIFGLIVVVIFTLLSIFLLKTDLKVNAVGRNEEAIRVVYIQQEGIDAEANEELASALETVA